MSKRQQRQIMRSIALGLVDALIIAASIVMAYLLRFDFVIRDLDLPLLPYIIGLNIIFILVAFNRFKIYRRLWQYAGIGELVALIRAIFVAEIAFFAGNVLIHRINTIYVVPRTIYLISLPMIIMGIGGSRILWRMYRDSYIKAQSSAQRTLIVGAGDAGVLMLRELKHSNGAGIFPVAFIDDDRTKWGLQVVGLPVLGGRDIIPEVVEKYSIQKIIIAIPSATREEIASIIDICKSTRAQIKILPRLSDLVDEKVSISMIREVSVEDLLGRDPIQVDLEGIANYVTGQVVLVTGAGGSIGSELCRQIAPFEPKELLLLGHGENSIYDVEIEINKDYPELKTVALIADIQDRRRIEEIFSIYHPAVVFHAAAHKHVPLMEKNPAEAIKNNVFGTKNVADCAHLYGATHFVMISTDKAVNPTSVMGATKRVAELYVRGLGRTSETKFTAVRFGNVLGSRGSVIPLFQRQIKNGGPITVTHPDIIRYFMTIPEAVQLVIQSGAFAKGGEIFVLDMGKPVKIADLARDLIRLSGLEPEQDIKIVYTGLRPGEKLYEELLTSEEGMTATRHNRIFIGRPEDYPGELLQQHLNRLEEVFRGQDLMTGPNEIREILKKVVPTYQLPHMGSKEIAEARAEVAVASKP